MNDRFRFRVWNIKEKEMIYNAEIAYDGMNYNTEWQLGKNQNDGWVDCFGYYLDYPEEYEVMQCTGLKDKNGKLIYEGDILKHDLVKCDIVYDDYSFMAHVWLADDIVPLTELTDDFGNCPFNVIGNIYENEDILKG